MSAYHAGGEQVLRFGLLPAVLVTSVIVVPNITVATETSLAQVPSAEAMMPAIAISAGETAPPRYAVGWSDTNPSAQMANHDSAVHSQRLLSYGATLVPFVFVLLTSSPDG